MLIVIFRGSRFVSSLVRENHGHKLNFNSLDSNRDSSSNFQYYIIGALFLSSFMINNDVSRSFSLSLSCLMLFFCLLCWSRREELRWIESDGVDLETWSPFWVSIWLVRLSHEKKFFLLFLLFVYITMILFGQATTYKWFNETVKESKAFAVWPLACCPCACHSCGRTLVVMARTCFGFRLQPPSALERAGNKTIQQRAVSIT